MGIWQVRLYKKTTDEKPAQVGFILASSEDVAANLAQQQMEGFARADVTRVVLANAHLLKEGKIVLASEFEKAGSKSSKS